VKPLFDKLQSLEISSMGPGPASDRAGGSSNLGELTERVIRRADKLRDEWSALHHKRRLRLTPLNHFRETLVTRHMETARSCESDRKVVGGGYVSWPVVRHRLVLRISATLRSGALIWALRKRPWSFLDCGLAEGPQNMNQRLSLDPGSSKRFLSSVLRQIKRQLCGSVGDQVGPQWVPDLIRIRQEVENERLDLNAVMNRLVKLTQRVVDAGGAGVWLFGSNEIFYCAGAGSASNDERLRLDVISMLATSCQLGKDSPLPLREPTATGTAYDAGYDPASVKSLLVAPIHQGQGIAGALAAFSDQPSAFTECDADNIHVLADVLGPALSKAAEKGLQQGVALEAVALLQLIERIIPGLQRMLAGDERERHSTQSYPQREPEPELPTISMNATLLQAAEKARAVEAIGGAWTELEQTSPAPPEDSETSAELEDAEVSRKQVWAVFKNKVVEPSTLWTVVRHRCEHAVAFAGTYSSRTVKLLRRARSFLLTRNKEAGGQVWHTVRDSFDFPPLTTNAVKRALRWTKTSISKAETTAIARLQILFRFQPGRRALRTAAPALAMLILTITFLILKTGLLSPAHTVASRSRTGAQENTSPLNARNPEYREPAGSAAIATAGTPEAHMAGLFGISPPLQVSHMRVTDRATEEAVRTLSRYELAGLSRRAVYGDDSAAFEIGMAYEIGRRVPQSCTTAAQWVARAAEEGNAAAQYNLGLRYRDADGVRVNDKEAIKWLQKAAQQSSDAQVALAVLTTHQARVVLSRP
jgi:hypothetical protein